MPYVNVGKENSGAIDLYYEDHGAGRPVVLVHGWPLSGASWEKQTAALLSAGHRVVTYDRRGFGQSSKPTTGYDYGFLTADLEKLVRAIDLPDFALVGFSMGAGEVAHYLGTRGTKRVTQAAFISGVCPYLAKAADNPEGLAAAVFDGLQKGIAADRPALLSGFLADFYNLDVFRGKRVSDQMVQSSWNVAVGASPKGTLDCVTSWKTDFRKDLSRVEIPTLVIHGDADRVLPIAATGARMPKALPGCHLVVLEGAPHGLIWTHADRVASELVEFLG